MSIRLHALRNSAQHLAEVASDIAPADYMAPAYPSNWSIADTFSHLGSGAVIGQRRFEDSIAQRESDPAFNTSVWDEWNAKESVAQVMDCLASDAALIECLDSATEAQRSAFHFSMGPFTFDFDGLVGLRLGEHVLHSWDVEVPFNPQATLPNDAANALLDSIQFIVSRTGVPTGDIKNVTLRTSEPTRNFSLVLDLDSVDFVEARHDGAVDLEIPAEALIRLIYGRLDDEHTTDDLTGAVVSELRQVFPGF
ncbi:MAG: maleylpyruvate isomerase N-terminal domain-containing protein [Acidimicrobiales bacterium]